MSGKNLPRGWAETTLGEIHHDMSGGINPAQFPDEKFELYSVPRHANGEPEFVTGAEIGSNKQTTSGNTVLLCKINPRINRVWVVRPRTDLRTIASTEWISFSPRPEINPNYLAYFLRQTEVRDFLAQRASGVGGSLMRVKPSTFSDFPFVLAPRDEQDRIVAEIEKQFTRLDAATAALKRVQANLKRYRASVLKAACEGRLVPTEAELARKEGRDYEPADQLLQRILRERRARWEADTLAKMIASGKPPKDDRWKQKHKEPSGPDANELPGLPEGWCWAAVEQLNPPTRPCAYGVLQPGSDVENGVPVVRVGDIEDGSVATSGLKRISNEIADRYPRTLLQGGEVLMTLVGAIGRTAVAPVSLAGANTARAVGVIPIQADMVRPEWVEIWFRNPEMIRTMIGKAHEVARMTLNLEDVRSATVALPPLAEQSRIIQKFDEAMSRFRPILIEVENQLQRGTRLRQSILRSAFCGKLLPQDPTDDPTSLLLEGISADRSARARQARSPRHKEEPAYG
ncbi:MAG TPA: hypothetical protein VMU48_20455 [Terracidiphilus sp.]|nr:hypothetical protein [Terracidiphilus sp.]